MIVETARKRKIRLIAIYAVEDLDSTASGKNLFEVGQVAGASETSDDERLFLSICVQL